MLKHGLCRTMRRHSISSAYIFSIAAGSGAIRLVHSPADVGVLEKKVVSAPDNAIDFTRLRAWWRPDTSTLLNGSQLSTSFRSALLRASGGPNKNNNSGKNNKKDENGGDGENEGDDDAPEAWIVPRTCLFVVSVLLMSFLLWKMAQPRGVHTGWASMLQHAGEIELIKLYEHYAQVYATDRKVHLGLVSDADTQQHLDQLSDARMKAVEKAKQERAELLAQKAKQPQPASTDAAAKGTEQKPAVVEEEVLPEISEAELQVMLAGRPMAESALYGLGVFAWVVPFVFFPVFVMLLSQYIGKSLSYAVDSTKGKTKAKEMIFKVERACGTKFRDIAGMKEPKKEITEIVDFLRHPERYTKLGAKIPTGALLLGPPGTGKTLLAKAVAGESDVAFIPVCGSDFVELYVGMGALRVRQLFKVAKKQRCIIYIDEIDAIGLKRQGSGHGEKQEQEQTLNELLTQLDGFKTGKRGEVMVLASSNVAQEALDPALIRPGRFDRIIHVDTPVISERIDIFKVHLSKLKLTEQASSVEEEAKEAEATNKTEKGEEEEEVLVATSNATTPAATATPVAGAETSTQEAATATTSATSSVDAASPTTKDTPTSDETAVVVSTLTDPADAVDPADYHFDFHSLLANKSETERALIDAYADRMSNLCPGFVGADIANVCNEGAILAAREDASHVHIHHLERSIDRVLAGIEHRSRAMSDFEKNVVAHHEAGHAVAGWFLSRADPLMKVSIVPRGGSALGYAQYLPSENRNRTAQEIKDSIAVTLGGRIAEKIFFDHLSTGASDDLRKVGRMAYEYVASFYPGSVYPAPGSSHTRYVKPFGERRSNLFDQRAKQLVDEVYQETYALLLSHKKDMEMLAAHLLKHELLTYQDVVKYLGARKDRPTDRKKTV